MKSKRHIGDVSFFVTNRKWQFYVAYPFNTVKMAKRMNAQPSTTDRIPIFMWKFKELASVTLFALIQSPQIKVDRKDRQVTIPVITISVFIFYLIFYTIHLFLGGAFHSYFS